MTFNDNTILFIYIFHRLHTLDHINIFHHQGFQFPAVASHLSLEDIFAEDKSSFVVSWKNTQQESHFSTNMDL